MTNLIVIQLNCRSAANKLGEIKLMLYTKKTCFSSLRNMDNQTRAEVCGLHCSVETPTRNGWRIGNTCEKGAPISSIKLKSL